MGILKRIKDHKLFPSRDSAPVKPPVLERLEPRILLSGDGLLNIAPPDPIQDTPQVVRYAELLESDEEVEQDIDQEGCRSCPDGSDLLEPILTISVDESTIPDDDDPSVLSDDSCEGICDETSTAEAVHVSVDEPTTQSPAFPTEDGSMPTYVSDADLNIEYATSIEIRGPPESESAYSTADGLITYAISDGYAETFDVGSVYELKAPDLPGLQLVDSDISSWEWQVVYLDFDGAEDVTYNGPVTVGPFDIPRFAARGELAGQEDIIIAQILQELERTFSGSGIVFTTQQPTTNQPFSTIYVEDNSQLTIENAKEFGHKILDTVELWRS